MPSARSLVATLVVAIVVGLAGLAWADTVDDLARKLRGDPDYKVRLSAALSLGKLGDRRGVGALVDALGDRDRSVRAVAAGALGKIIDSSVDAGLRDRALATLGEMARSDADPGVRDQAQKAYAAVQPRTLAPTPPPAAKAGGVYVEVGPMADTTRRSPSVPPIMRQQVMTSLGKGAPQYLTRWPTGRAPTEVDLQKSGASGFYIDGTLVSLTVSKAPPHVSCQVSLLLATFPGKSMFAFSKGGADVEAASTSDGALAEATSDCVGAVVDDIVVSKLVPTIRSRAR